MTKILFINKARHEYWNDSCQITNNKSSGLYNSVRFIVDMLNKHDVSAEMEEAIDNNCIDRLVTKHKPDCVIIEALWVVPEKFDILQELHPKVKWIVRLHSEIPFISTEGIAFEWMSKYLERDICIGVNSKRFYHDMKKLYNDCIMYLPNYYDINMYDNHLVNAPTHITTNATTINVGCFGAIRPLKNQLIQAIAAIEYANNKKKQLVFHINGGRIEDNASSTLKNIRALFATLPHHKLQEHTWMAHDEFVHILRQMDLLMQVSLSETYNIVAADAVSVNVPVVASHEISFIADPFRADATSTVDIVDKISNAICYPRLNTMWNKYLLKNDSKTSKKIWLKEFD